jgi:hypothetical protein
MALRILLIVFALFGIASTFMPWLHYPKPNATVYGYLSDGIVTGFLFLIIFIFSIYSYKKGRYNYIGGGLVALTSLWMGFEAYKKIIDIEAEKLNFSTDDPIVALSTAGFHQGIGIYVMGIAGMCVFTTIVMGLITQSIISPSTEQSSLNPNSKRNALVISTVSFVLVALFAYFYISGVNLGKPDSEELKNSISNSVSDMGKAIMNENYEEFVSFNHPIMIQSYGGKQRTKDLLSATLSELKKSGYKVKSASLSEVHDVKYKQKNIQAIISQVLALDSMGTDKTEIQKMIAISENNGETWSFININGKSKAEVSKNFPILNQNLNF